MLCTLVWGVSGVSHGTPLPALENASIEQFHGSSAQQQDSYGPLSDGAAHEGCQAKVIAPTVGDEPFLPPSNANLPEHILPPLAGFAYPVEHPRLMRGFDGAGCFHQGIDIGAYGPHGGVGKTVFAITESVVTFIGTPEKSAHRYGRRDRRSGMVKRGGYVVPRRMDVDGYGTVYPVTRNHGAARTGVFLVTQALHPLIEGYSVRYMHFAALRSDLKVGDILKAGEEIGIMGSTAILESAPHVHIDMEDQRNVRVDVAPFIGLNRLLASKCRPRNKAAWAKRRRFKRHRGH